MSQTRVPVSSDQSSENNATVVVPRLSSALGDTRHRTAHNPNSRINNTNRSDIPSNTRTSASSRRSISSSQISKNNAKTHKHVVTRSPSTIPSSLAQSTPRNSSATCTRRPLLKPTRPTKVWVRVTSAILGLLMIGAVFSYLSRSTFSMKASKERSPPREADGGGDDPPPSPFAQQSLNRKDKGGSKSEPTLPTSAALGALEEKALKKALAVQEARLALLDHLRAMRRRVVTAFIGTSQSGLVIVSPLGGEKKRQDIARVCYKRSALVQAEVTNYQEVSLYDGGEQNNRDEVAKERKRRLDESGVIKPMITSVPCIDIDFDVLNEDGEWATAMRQIKENTTVATEVARTKEHYDGRESENNEKPYQYMYRPLSVALGRHGLIAHFRNVVDNWEADRMEISFLSPRSRNGKPEEKERDQQEEALRVGEAVVVVANERESGIVTVSSKSGRNYRRVLLNKDGDDDVEEGLTVKGAELENDVGTHVSQQLEGDGNKHSKDVARNPRDLAGGGGNVAAEDDEDDEDDYEQEIGNDVVNRVLITPATASSPPSSTENDDDNHSVDDVSNATERATSIAVNESHGEELPSLQARRQRRNVIVGRRPLNVAVTMSGLMRSWRYCAPSLVKNLLSRHYYGEKHFLGKKTIQRQSRGEKGVHGNIALFIATYTQEGHRDQGRRKRSFGEMNLLDDNGNEPVFDNHRRAKRLDGYNVGGPPPAPRHGPRVAGQNEGNELDVLAMAKAYHPFLASLYLLDEPTITLNTLTREYPKAMKNAHAAWSVYQLFVMQVAFKLVLSYHPSTSAGVRRVSTHSDGGTINWPTHWPFSTDLFRREVTLVANNVDGSAGGGQRRTPFVVMSSSALKEAYMHSVVPSAIANPSLDGTHQSSASASTTSSSSTNGGPPHIYRFSNDHDERNSSPASTTFFDVIVRVRPDLFVLGPVWFYWEAPAFVPAAVPTGSNTSSTTPNEKPKQDATESDDQQPKVPLKAVAVMAHSCDPFVREWSGEEGTTTTTQEQTTWADEGETGGHSPSSVSFVEPVNSTKENADFEWAKSFPKIHHTVRIKTENELLRAPPHPLFAFPPEPLSDHSAVAYLAERPRIVPAIHDEKGNDVKIDNRRHQAHGEDADHSDVQFVMNNKEKRRMNTPARDFFLLYELGRERITLREWSARGGKTTDGALNRDEVQLKRNDAQKHTIKSLPADNINLDVAADDEEALTLAPSTSSPTTLSFEQRLEEERKRQMEEFDKPVLDPNHERVLPPPPPMRFDKNGHPIRDSLQLPLGTTPKDLAKKQWLTNENQPASGEDTSNHERHQHGIFKEGVVCHRKHCHTGVDLFGLMKIEKEHQREENVYVASVESIWKEHSNRVGLSTAVSPFGWHVILRERAKTAVQQENHPQNDGRQAEHGHRDGDNSQKSANPIEKPLTGAQLNWLVDKIFNIYAEDVVVAESSPTSPVPKNGNAPIGMFWFMCSPIDGQRLVTDDQETAFYSSLANKKKTST